jgi:hypothetical protein
MKRHLLLPLLLLSSSLCRAQEYIPFTAAEGVRTAQATLGVQSAPALVGTSQVDTAGYSLFWYYTFPDADSAAVVARRADSTFWGGREGIGDTAWVPVHVRGASLPSWANSTAAMERIRGVEEFQQWAAQYFDPCPDDSPRRVAPETTPETAVAIHRKRCRLGLHRAGYRRSWNDAPVLVLCRARLVTGSPMPPAR